MFWIKWITSCSSDFVTPLFLAEVTCKFFGFCGVEMVSFFGVNWKCWWLYWYCLDGSFLNVSRWNGLVTNFLSFQFYYLGGKLFYLILLFLILRVVFSCYFSFYGWCCLAVTKWLFISSGIKLLRDWCLVFVCKVAYAQHSLKFVITSFSL